MNIVISIEHPAWAHQFKKIIKVLEEENHNVIVFAVKKDINIQLLEKFDIRYTKVANTTGKGIIHKAWLLLSITAKMFAFLLNKKPDLFIGRASPMIAINAFLFRKPHIIFEDTDHSYISLFICKLFSKKIITNIAFRTDLGKKHIKIDTLKELFYLHPAIFTPDENILTEVGLIKNETFSIIRFVAWEADHDMGCDGLSLDIKRNVITELLKFGKVFITSEKELPEEFKQYQIRLSPEKIHSFIYYSSLVYGESATMATEAAILGVHSIFCDFAGRGYTDELESKYGLVSNFKLDKESQLNSVTKAVELIRQKDIFEIGKNKAKRLIKDKINGTEYFLSELIKYIDK